MNIKRKRFVLMRNNRTEIWCGLARHYHWTKLSELENSPIKTYLSKTKALSSCSSWDNDYEAVEIIESFKTVDE